MAASKYLLIAFSPLLATMCFSVLIYERLALIKYEAIEDPFASSRITINLLALIFKVLFLPFSVYRPLRDYMTAQSMHAFFNMIGSFRRHLWSPVVSEIVPNIYLHFNARVYEPLERWHIRVIQILPGSPSDGLRVELVHMAREDIHMAFDALSYSWGGHLLMRRIIHVNDRPFLVTATAFNALRALRDSTAVRKIWIDAICINQYDTTEKNHQVRDMMRLIYSQAAQVTVWLGQAPCGLGSCLRQVHDLASVSDDEVSKKQNDLDLRSFDSLFDLLGRRWWARIWTVQEVALSQNVVIRSGDYMLRWTVLARFFQRLYGILEAKRDISMSNFMDQLEDLNSRPWTCDANLMELALRWRHRTSRDPRDKIYGLLGLTDSTDLHPDWSKPTSHIFAHFAGRCMYRTKSWALMTLAEGRHTAGCSWAVDWETMGSYESATLDSVPFDLRKTTPENLNMLWNGGLLPSIVADIRTYSAAGDTEMRCAVDDLTWNSIQAIGWVEDAVAVVGQTFEREGGVARGSFQHQDEADAIFKGWRSLALDSLPVNDTGTENIFWRTLKLDTNRVGSPGPSIRADDIFYWPHSGVAPSLLAFHESEPQEQRVNHGCGARKQSKVDAIFDEGRDQAPKAPGDVHCVQGHYGSNMEQPRRIRGHPSCLGVSDDQGHLTTRGIAYVCCFQRRFFITRSGLFGIGPAAMRKRDRICVLLGCPVPLVLRPRSANRKKHWEFIGQAYVDGIMDYNGSAQHDIDKGKLKVEVFLIA